MSSSPVGESHAQLEIAHVLFMDIVAYSRLPMEQQTRLSVELQSLVRDSVEFQRAEQHDQLLRLPTGDGMALIFFGDPEAPVRCALEVSRAISHHPDLKLRIGIHSGPVQRVDDINASRNVSGAGINYAQRVMEGERHISWDGLPLPGLHKDGTEIPVVISFGEFTRGGKRVFTGFAKKRT